jgi:competence protein ComEC
MTSCPALLLGLHLLLGTAWALFPHPIYLLFHLLLFFLTPLYRWFGPTCVLFAFGWATLTAPPTLAETYIGEGVFHIEKVTPSESPFGRSLAYKGTFNSIPCTAYFPEKKRPPDPKRDYWVEGKLEKAHPYRALLKPYPKALLIPLKKNGTLANWRFDKKSQLRAHLHQVIQDKKVAQFLSTLATGEIDDRSLSMEFKQAGLSHILAISGFHFALVALFLGGLFRLLLPWRLALIAQLLTLGALFLFLGPSPSITRAYIALTLFLIGRLIGRRAGALQLLGVGLCLELLFDPTIVAHAGFHLSFLCTLGLLLLTGPIEKKLEWLLPKRPFGALDRMKINNLHAILLLSPLRKLLAATLAIQLTSLPVTLFFFGTIPLYGLIANLFFPLWLSLSLLLLLLSFLLPPLHLVNSIFTAALLRVISHPPAPLNYSFGFGPLPLLAALIPTALILFFGLKRSEASC